MLGLDLETIVAIAAAGGPSSLPVYFIRQLPRDWDWHYKKPLIHVPPWMPWLIICGGATGAYLPDHGCKEKSKVYTRTLPHGKWD